MVTTNGTTQNGKWELQETEGVIINSAFDFRYSEIFVKEQPALSARTRV